MLDKYFPQQGRIGKSNVLMKKINQYDHGLKAILIV